MNNKTLGTLLVTFLVLIVLSFSWGSNQREVLRGTVEKSKGVPEPTFLSLDHDELQKERRMKEEMEQKIEKEESEQTEEQTEAQSQAQLQAQIQAQIQKEIEEQIQAQLQQEEDTKPEEEEEEEKETKKETDPCNRGLPVCGSYDLGKLWSSPLPPPPSLSDYQFRADGIQTYYHKKSETIFCPVPKTGSTALWIALRRLQSPIRTKRNYYVSADFLSLNSSNIMEYYGLKEENPGLFRFHMTRNPFQRIASVYNHKILGNLENPGATKAYQEALQISLKPGENFEGDPKTGAWVSFPHFIELLNRQDWREMNHHFTPISKLCLDEILEYDFVGDSSCPRDQKFLQETLGVENNGVNHAPGRPLCDMYDLDTFRKVLEIYSLDFSMFRFGVPEDLCQCLKERDLL